MIKKEKTMRELKEENQRLKDEIESLWKMLDEIRESDIKNYSEQIKQGIEDKILEMKLLSMTKPVKA